MHALRIVPPNFYGQSDLTPIRLLIPALALSLLGLNPAAGADDLNGAWTGWVCPQRGVSDPARCSSFSLQLLQRNNRLCGSHLFATAGARQMDEGGLPSLLATMADGQATGTIESVRESPPVRIPITLQIEGDELHWQRTANPPGDYLLPGSIRMKRSRQAGLSPLSEQRLSASCSAYLDMPTDPGPINPIAAPATPR